MKMEMVNTMKRGPMETHPERGRNKSERGYNVNKLTLDKEIISSFFILLVCVARNILSSDDDDEDCDNPVFMCMCECICIYG